MLFDDLTPTAIFSPCRTWRYILRRSWAKGPSVGFCLLNPSMGDEDFNDPTIRRLVDFSKIWGFSGLVLANAHALCSTDPDQLYSHPNPVGPENNRYLREFVAEVEGCVVIGWGMHGEFMGRGKETATLLRDAGASLKAFASTKGGQPVHPLYMPADRPLSDWPQ